MRFFFTVALALSAAICGCTPTSSSLPKTSVAPVSQKTNIASLSTEQLGVERVFTNTQIMMWMPLNAKYSDEDWHGYDLAYVKFDTIEIMIQIKDSGQEQEHALESDIWGFQDYPILGVRDWPTRDEQPRKQMRKTIWDATRKRKLSINGTVLSSEIYAYDIETAEKMIESIRLLKPQPNDK